MAAAVVAVLAVTVAVISVVAIGHLDRSERGGADRPAAATSSPASTSSSAAVVATPSQAVPDGSAAVVVITVPVAPVAGPTAPAANPDAGTIAAIVSAAIVALGSLGAAFLGMKVVSDQSSRANETARWALKVAAQTQYNSTVNGNPTITDF